MSENNQGLVKTTNPSLYKSTAVYLFLGYFFWPFSLIGLKLEQEDDYIRFHCAQAMALFFLQLAIGVLYMVAMALTVIIIGFLLMPIVLILFVGSYVLVIIALIKAAKGEKYHLPVVGDFAEKNIMKWFIK